MDYRYYFLGKLNKIITNDIHHVKNHFLFSKDKCLN